MPTEAEAPTLNPVLRDFWLIPARNRVLYGGRSSSKSWDAAGFAVFLSCQCRIRVLCARQFQNRIAESVYTLIKIQIERFGLLGQFHITDNSIRNKITGSEFLFYGLWRHIDEIKSLEGIDICWIEEGHNLTEVQWEILEPTLRGEGSQFWIIFNPRLATDFVYKKFVVGTPDDKLKGKIRGVVGATIKRQINYDENPFLSDTIRAVIEQKRISDPEEYQHIYLGEPRDDDDSVIIKRHWIRASIDAHLTLQLPTTGVARIGFDVADSGQDLCAAVLQTGRLVRDCDEWRAKEDELLKSASRVHATARANGASITYDSIGLGAFAGSYFDSLNARLSYKVQYFGLNASSAVINPKKLVDPSDPKSPTNKAYYANRKAQIWGEAARKFRDTFNAIERGERITTRPDDFISIASSCGHLDSLIDELATPRRDFDNYGRVKVESKKDLAKRDVASPNKADAFVMADAAAPKKAGTYSRPMRTG